MRYLCLILLVLTCSCAGAGFRMRKDHVEMSISASYLYDEQPEVRSYDRTFDLETRVAYYFHNNIGVSFDLSNRWLKSKNFMGFGVTYYSWLLSPLIGLAIVFPTRDMVPYMEPVMGMGYQKYNVGGALKESDNCFAYGIGVGLKIPASSDVTFDIGFRWRHFDWDEDFNEEEDIFGLVLGLSIWF